jgi:hypothetical protein
LVTPEDLNIAMAENLTWALETSIPQYLQVSTTQALKDLSEVFTDASCKYSDDPTIHMPNAPPSCPHRELMESPRVSPPPPPWHTTSKGAHHYNFSNNTQNTTYFQLMWLSGRLMLLVAEVGGSNPCKIPRLE